MTDPELVAKKLAFVETCVRELRMLCRPEQIERDVRDECFAEHTLQVAVQALLDVASHIVSDERLGEPTTQRQMITLLERAGWLEPDLAIRIAAAAGFRNLLVHGYAEVDPARVRDVVENHLDGLLAFCTAMRRRLP